ncbi:hypothetical protein [Sulfitobacter donghicola]|uniref:AAA+ family ATPase n=1 Tax=Sulfitobacter donghicola DSW-25 = KCTC 12864 = JCM 14565 TaxID=1300350 RepID=A0A073IK90_9RHOB|nr:hypothetical protein [Sulfitobacter donghicola]KEJ89926.1 hypothetical protein DSW25_06850 [Sulfitobacter donghicola DSW-25 = KCTC 12864 = JCM 14565]KIN66949.1 hypothetical protein Z948_653 [Sulfitobacter donghicola DSW-25 = KCTC 12864 = JCM 14565]
MKHSLLIPLFALSLASPLAAEEEPLSLMERGAQLFFEGLMEEMAPALDGMADLLEEAGPALQEFVAEMGPKLRDVLEDVDDWSVYTAPEVLPNGDIIIRRKPDIPKDKDTQKAPQETSPQIDL